MNQTQALVWSLAIEVPVVMALAGPVADRRRLLAVAAACTLLTHPFAIASFAALRPHLPYPVRASVVALVEAGVLASVGGLPRGRALGASVAANAASYLTGLALRTWVL